MKFLLASMLLAASAYADEPNNLLLNGGFDQDALGWTQLPGTFAFWDTPDASFNSFSGSAWIVDDYLSATPNFRPVLSQCIVLPHGGRYVIRMSGYVTSAYAGVAIEGKYDFRVGPTCGSEAAANGYLIFPLSNSWHTLELATPDLPADGVMVIQLGTYRPYDGAEFSGHFDDIIVSDDAMFLGNFE